MYPSTFLLSLHFSITLKKPGFWFLFFILSTDLLHNSPHPNSPRSDHLKWVCPSHLQCWQICQGAALVTFTLSHGILLALLSPSRLRSIRSAPHSHSLPELGNDLLYWNWQWTEEMSDLIGHHQMSESSQGKAERIRCSDLIKTCLYMIVYTFMDGITVAGEKNVWSEAGSI